LEPANHDRLVAIVGVSMALTPLLLLGMQRILNGPLRARAPGVTGKARRAQARSYVALRRL
ncbi:hypothetical protein QT661_21800, partial [Xanthomonas citri pv. citri]